MRLIQYSLVGLYSILLLCRSRVMSENKCINKSAVVLNINIFVFVDKILFKLSCRKWTILCSQIKMFSSFNARHPNFERKLSLMFLPNIHFFSWRYLYLYFQLLQAKLRKNLSLLAVPWINFYSSNRAAAVSAAMPRMVTLVVTIAKILKRVVMDFFCIKTD